MNDKSCPLALLLKDHICRDRDGNELDSRGRTCFYGARVHILGGTVIEQAERIVANHHAAIRLEHLLDQLFGPDRRDTV